MRAGRVTLFKAVKGGIYLSFSGRTYFAAGAHLFGSDLIPLEDAGAIPYSAENVARFKSDAQAGNDIRWMSTAGVCQGLDGGVFKNLSSKKYIVPSGVVSGATLYREQNGYGQYLCNLTLST